MDDHHRVYFAIANYLLTQRKPLTTPTTGGWARREKIEEGALLASLFSRAAQSPVVGVGAGHIKEWAAYRLYWVIPHLILLEEKSRDSTARGDI